jgi:mono/diheme cytochrome c family protein
VKDRVKKLAVAALLTSIAGFAVAEDVPATNPYSGDQAAIKSGKSDFRSICALCHGGNADGRGERAPANTADLRKFDKGFRRFVDIVSNGVQRPGREIKDMPAWGAVLDTKTIYNIGAYLETVGLDGSNWKEGASR